VTTLKGILDANMVIGLVKGDVFGLLRSLYTPLYIPSRVKQEILIGQGRPGEEELAHALGVWITEIAADVQGLPPVSASLSVADREVLAVAADLANAIDHILTGDDQLYQEAERAGHTCFSVTDVVVFLKEQQLIPSVKPVLDQMIRNGFGIGSDTYEQTLRIEGEWPGP